MNLKKAVSVSQHC